ncbi:MAG: NAD-dependent epimerase/dehydratase family protein [Terriglobales bacterium]|jgi:GDP-D-mannose 3', 5'-epimerase
MNEKNEIVMVAGADGFIGGSLVADLRRQGYTRIRAVGIKPFEEWYQHFPDVENVMLDLRDRQNCETASRGAYQIFMFAADMGGMGFIETHKAECMLSVLISTHMLMAAQKLNVQKYFYSSSACVYNASKQTDFACPGLKEEDAYPALAEDGYGWEKLFSERMCRHFREDYGLRTRVARYHNVYGPHGTWFGGREKAPAAICRKVIEAKLKGQTEIPVWGDGNQTRSFMYIDDCLKGTQMIMNSDILDPINLGSSEMVTINQLIDIAEDIAGKKFKRVYDLTAPKGVNGRNSDNTMIKKLLHWEPSISLREGLEKTYRWIYDQYVARENGVQVLA